MKHLLKYFILSLIIAGSVSCIDDSFTSSSSDTLEFSSDTLAFDTIFTDVTSRTRQFVVYNRHKKSINISSISLDTDAKDHFFINVDGIKGEEFQNVEIRGGDSIYIFVECFIDQNDKNIPIEVKGNINFLTNGVPQKVALTAWGQDVVRLYGPEITENTVFTAEKPYVIFDTIHVAKNATLTIQPGATLYFHTRAAIDVDGTLKAKGTKDQWINLRGDRIDKVVGQIDFDIMSGQWGGINIRKGSHNSEMAFVYMRSTLTGLNVKGTDAARKSLTLTNCVLHNSDNRVFTADSAWVEAIGTEFSEAAKSVVWLRGGKVDLTNCTIANYFLFKIIDGEMLYTYFWDDEHIEQVFPTYFNFNNCIIYGLGTDLNIGDFTDTEVYFRNCLLKSDGTDDMNFISCKWKGDPKFYTVRDKYIFDYRLHNESDAIGNADPSLIPLAGRTDSYGNPRIYEGGSKADIGAYVWVPEATENQ